MNRIIENIHEVKVPSFRGIVLTLFLAALAAPIFVLLMFAGTGVFFYLSNILSAGDMSPMAPSSLLMAGVVCGGFTAVISIPATVMLGLPLIYIAWKRSILSALPVLAGATAAIGFALAFFAQTYLMSPDYQLLLIATGIGVAGGFVNGLVFLRLGKRHKYFNRSVP